MKYITIIIIILILIFVFSRQEVSYDKKCYEGKIIKGSGLSSSINYPTLNLKLQENIPCGVYHAYTKYGKVTVFTHDNEAEIHFKKYNDLIENEKTIKICDLIKIKGNTGIIGYYSNNCK